MPWSGAPGWGRFSDIEPGAPGFEQVGINVHVLDPALRHGAGAVRATTSPEEAYREVRASEFEAQPYRPGDLGEPA